MSKEMKELKKDKRRWVLCVLRDGGKSEAQFPLPVTRNSIRVEFRKDIPQVVPFTWVEGIRQAVIPHWEAKTTETTSRDGRIRTADEIVMTGVKYICELKEIPMEFQSEAGLQKFMNENLQNDDEYADWKNAVMTIASTPQFSYEYAAEVAAALGPRSQAEPKPVTDPSVETARETRKRDFGKV